MFSLHRRAAAALVYIAAYLVVGVVVSVWAAYLVVGVVVSVWAAYLVVGVVVPVWAGASHMD